jgi:hypothetical protein
LTPGPAGRSALVAVSWENTFLKNVTVGSSGAMSTTAVVPTNARLGVHMFKLKNNALGSFRPPRSPSPGVMSRRGSTVPQGAHERGLRADRVVAHELHPKAGPLERHRADRVEEERLHLVPRLRQERDRLLKTAIGRAATRGEYVIVENALPVSYPGWMFKSSYGSRTSWPCSAP